MADLITRARKEWCESRFGTGFPSEWTTPEHSHRQCPPEVVSALLDLLDGMSPPILEDARLHYVEVQIDGALIEDAKAAIARALEKNK
jgi:hypothetical protein